MLCTARHPSFHLPSSSPQSVAANCDRSTEQRLNRSLTAAEEDYRPLQAAVAPALQITAAASQKPQNSATLAPVAEPHAIYMQPKEADLSSETDSKDTAAPAAPEDDNKSATRKNATSVKETTSRRSQTKALKSSDDTLRRTAVTATTEMDVPFQPTPPVSVAAEAVASFEPTPYETAAAVKKVLFEPSSQRTPITSPASTSSTCSSPSPISFAARHYSPKETSKSGVQVDYFTHNWDEADLESCWKVMTKKKKDLANGVRLENASWRTWAKQRNNLKTVKPSEVNWFKDGDITWLYGPLHSIKPPQKPNYTSVASKLLRLKSVLKRPPPDDCLTRLRSNLSPGEAEERQLRWSHSDICGDVPLKSPGVCGLPFSELNRTLSKQRIRFKQEVEQCIAIESEDTGDAYARKYSSSSARGPTSQDELFFSASNLLDSSSIEGQYPSYQSTPYSTEYSTVSYKVAGTDMRRNGSYSSNRDDAHYSTAKDSASSSSTDRRSSISRRGAPGRITLKKAPSIAKLKSTTLKSENATSPLSQPQFTRYRNGTPPCRTDSTYDRNAPPVYSEYFPPMESDRRRYYDDDDFVPTSLLNSPSGITFTSVATYILTSLLSSSVVREEEADARRARKAELEAAGLTATDDEEPSEGRAYGLFDQCQDIVINIAEVVRWCGSMVANSSLF